MSETNFMPFPIRSAHERASANKAVDLGIGHPLPDPRPILRVLVHQASVLAEPPQSFVASAETLDYWCAIVRSLHSLANLDTYFAPVLTKRDALLSQFAHAVYPPGCERKERRMTIPPTVWRFALFGYLGLAAISVIFNNFLVARHFDEPAGYCRHVRASG